MQAEAEEMQKKAEEQQKKMEEEMKKQDAADAKAKGEADANVAVAEGQAQANRALNASLSPKVLQYIAIQKLNPRLQIAVLPAGTNAFIDPTKLLQAANSGSK